MLRLEAIVDRPVMVQLAGELERQATLVGFGDDGFGGTCVYVRMDPGGPILVGVHPSRLRLVDEDK